MSEIVKFVNHGAATITPAMAEKVLRHLPQWKLEFTQINAPKPTLTEVAALAGKLGRALPFIAILVPARDEAAVIHNTLARLA